MAGCEAPQWWRGVIIIEGVVRRRAEVHGTGVAEHGKASVDIGQVHAKRIARPKVAIARRSSLGRGIAQS